MLGLPGHRLGFLPQRTVSAAGRRLGLSAYALWTGDRRTAGAWRREGTERPLARRQLTGSGAANGAAFLCGNALSLFLKPELPLVSWICSGVEEASEFRGTCFGRTCRLPQCCGLTLTLTFSYILSNRLDILDGVVLQSISLSPVFTQQTFGSPDGPCSLSTSIQALASTRTKVFRPKESSKSQEHHRQENPHTKCSRWSPPLPTRLSAAGVLR